MASSRALMLVAVLLYSQMMLLHARKAIFITMCDTRYFPGAVNLLSSLKDKGEWSGDVGVLVSDNIKPCALDIFRKMGVYVFTARGVWSNQTFPILDEQQQVRGVGHTTVHFEKLSLFTEHRFRDWDIVVYADSDMQAIAPLELSKLIDGFTPPDNDNSDDDDDVNARDAEVDDVGGNDDGDADDGNDDARAQMRSKGRGEGWAAAYVRIGNPTVNFYRESSISVPQWVQDKFPDRYRVHSTRFMVLNMKEMPLTLAMKDQAKYFMDRYLFAFNALWEQGLLQLLFYDSLRDVDAHRLDGMLEHFYHSNLPWMPGNKQFASFALRYERATENDTTCWRPLDSLMAERNDKWNSQ